eukprot:TRINITY_DN7008_c0_g1_i1.p1 TRINITY_DN7008_c0_g1~~TRINITY_DN7008_c0_g1_i1.p1  ORF type:complete len:441 (+),score=96.45 TRINITY_DN7008_c0_g1_i1:53-1324(+)
MARKGSADMVIEGERAKVEPEMEREYKENLGGKEHDNWDMFELHWNMIRNVFPQMMRCQEREDAVTDNYCDQLGPRGLGPLGKDGRPQSCVPTSHSGVPASKSVEDYKKNVMPNHILPLWDYLVDSTREAVSLPKAAEKGYVPAGTATKLCEDMLSNTQCDSNFNEKQCLSSRFLDKPRLLTDKELDTPLTEAEYNHWRKSVEELKRYSENAPDDDDLPSDLQRVAGVPFLDRSADKYEVLTWQWMRCRVQEEDEEIAKHGLRLIPNIFLQMACAVCIWALGATEIKGGRVEVVIASFTIGIVCIVSGVVGIIGALAENELYLRIFWIGQVWSLSLLTAFLYVELHHVQANDYACNPGSDLTGGGTSGDCDEDTKMIVASIILCLVEVTFGCVVERQWVQNKGERRNKYTSQVHEHLHDNSLA